MQLQTLQYLIDLQAKERERERGEQRESEMGREGEKERELSQTSSFKRFKTSPCRLATESTLHWPGNWLHWIPPGNSHCGGKSITICQGQIIKVKIIQILRPKVWPNN